MCVHVCVYCCAYKICLCLWLIVDRETAEERVTRPSFKRLLQRALKVLPQKSAERRLL